MEPEINSEIVVDDIKYRCYEIHSVQNCWNCDLYAINSINRKKCDFKCKPEERQDNKMVFLKKIYEYV